MVFLNHLILPGFRFTSFRLQGPNIVDHLYPCAECMLTRQILFCTWVFGLRVSYMINFYGTSRAHMFCSSTRTVPDTRNGIFFARHRCGGVVSEYVFSSWRFSTFLHLVLSFMGVSVSNRIYVSILPYFCHSYASFCVSSTTNHIQGKIPFLLRLWIF